MLLWVPNTSMPARRFVFGMARMLAKLVAGEASTACCFFLSVGHLSSNRLDHLVDELLLCLDVQILLIRLGQASSDGDSLCDC
jgi:hypothetical protein